MMRSMRQRTDIGRTIGRKRGRPGLELGLTITAVSFILLSVAPPAVSITKLVTKSSGDNGTSGAATGVGASDERSQELPNVSEHEANEDTCLTAACNETAAVILNNLDRSVEPCENFYRYACGGYLNSTNVPDDEAYVNSFVSTEGKLYEKLRAIVEAAISPNEPRAYGLVKKYYKSCMNESAIEARGVQPLLASLQRIGGWPVVEGASWNESNFDWTKAIYELRKSGHHFHCLINFEVGVNLQNSTEHAIHISPPRHPIFDDRGSKHFFKKTFPAYFNYIVNLATSLGAPDNSIMEFAETLSFEWKLMVKMPTSNNTGNMTAEYNPMTLTELERNYPNIPWQEYISKILPSTVPVEKNQVLIVKTPTYFEKLDKLMPHTSKRVLANYIAQTTAFYSVKYLHKEMLEKRQPLLADLTRATKASPRWKICIGSVSSLSFAVESMYVSRHVSPDTKMNAASIVDDIRKAIREMLETANWMDQNTKSRALQKLDSMSSYFAYSDRLPDDKLDAIYEKLEIDEDNYYENVHKVSLFNTEYSLGKLREAVDRSDMFGEKTATVGAMYNPLKNVIVLTASILQDGFFGKDRPRYMNYGAIGTTIGHEIIHAFDDVGGQFNGEGELVDWWEPKSKKEYLERAQCIVDQYSNYTIQGSCLKVNGELTRNENIADNGGIKGAYRAYKNWLAKNGEEPKLPGINMTTNQLFWMSAANVLCTKYTTADLIDRINTDRHSLHEFRIVGSMSNMPEFTKDFACPVGSKMNPAKKCSVW